MCLAVGAVDRSRRHHHHRNEPAINKHGEPDEHDQLKRAEYDHFHDRDHDIVFTLHVDGTVDVDDGYFDILARGLDYDAAVRAVFDAAAAVLAVDVGVDPAGDRVPGPADNTLQRLRDEWLDRVADYFADISGPTLAGARDAARRYTAARDRDR